MSKLIVISDNRSLEANWKTEHGLCLYLDTGKSKVLLDTGASSNFIDNAVLAGINLNEIDYVFLSHAHTDHVGGLNFFLQINTTAKVLVSKNVIGKSFFSNRKGLHEIGPKDNWEEFKNRFVFIDRMLDIDEEIKVFAVQNLKYPLPKANECLFVNTGGHFRLDTFNHELVFACQTDTLFVYTGCAHKGILNILTETQKLYSKKIDLVVGGFHLLDSTIDNHYENEEDLERIAKTLKEKYSETSFLTGHCTGDNVFNTLIDFEVSQLTMFYTSFTHKF